MPVTATVIAAAVSAGTATAGTIAGVRDARLRNRYEQALSTLDFDQKKKLNDELMKKIVTLFGNKIAIVTGRGLVSTKYSLKKYFDKFDKKL